MDSEASSMHLTVLTPARTYFKGDVGSIRIPTQDGYIGVLPDHAPLLAVLGYGTLHLHGTEGEKNIIVDGGFLEVNHNKVTVLANAAEDPTRLIEERVRQELADAEALPVSTESERKEKMSRLLAARARMRFLSGI